jgi:hypothetical protein
MLPRMTGLGEALTLSSLVAGTLEYAILIRHREERRQADLDDALIEAAGRSALYRTHLLGDAPRRRGWSAFGARFR